MVFCAGISGISSPFGNARSPWYSLRSSDIARFVWGGVARTICCTGLAKMTDNVNPYQPPRTIDDASSPRVGDSIIRITRTKSYADRLRAYRIIVNGAERGRLKAGCTIDIPVDVGNHTVAAKIDWCGSPNVNVTSTVGSIVMLSCESNLQGLRIFLAIFYTTLFRGRYLTLTQT